MSRGPSRRAVLLGGAALALASCSTPMPTGRMISGSFRSARCDGADIGWAVSYPRGHNGRLPVLIALHGRGGDHRSAFTDLHLDGYLSQVVGAGVAPFAIASVDGGDHSYWHPRRDGDRAGMVIDEFIPLLHAHGLDIGRVGLLGWSMGGYGALYLASVLGSGRVAVAIAESPALWHQPGQSAEGAFDDAADFERHDVWRRLRRLAGIALRIDCGAADGFAPITRDLREALSPTPAGGIEPGGHDAAYWRSQAPAQLRFAGAHLAAR